MGLKVRRVLMTGVSYMIPFVAAGGLLIALSFLLGGYEIVDHAAIVNDNTFFNLPDVEALGLDHALFGSGFFAYLGAVFFVLGATAFKFLVPALAGYIAYAIADRPGIAPGFVMGALAIDLGGFGTPQSGFLGGIVGGVLAGVVAAWIAGRRVPTWARGLMPVLVIPLLATLVSGFIMVVVLGKPLGALITALNDGLTAMADGGAGIVLGIVLGLMMAFDMGGPLNKTAYLFATTGLAAAATATDAPQLNIMAAVMLAGMVPPAGAGAGLPGPSRVCSPRRSGRTARPAGCSARPSSPRARSRSPRPTRCGSSRPIMAGSAVTGALAMGLDVGMRAPHGGIFVLFAADNMFGFLFALLAGTLVAAAAVIALKTLTEDKSEIDELATVAV